MKKTLLSALAVLASSSYCFSEVINGSTNNAAANGNQWDMDNVLPPQAGLTVGGVLYRYTAEKEIPDDFKVTIENDDVLGGYIFQETDDWSGKPGNTIQKILPIDDVLIDRFGDGRIRTEGEGEVVDPTVRYTYTYDECFDPLASPECPGYAAAFMQYLLDNGLLNEEDIQDAYYSDEVQDALNQKTELQEENEEATEEEEEEEEEDNTEKLLSIKDEVNDLANTVTQDAMLVALAQVQKLDNYVQKNIEGGSYTETVQLQDKKINDNRGAAVRMGLAQDQVHNEMVESQYK